jgi:hypothetical protein
MHVLRQYRLEKLERACKRKLKRQGEEDWESKRRRADDIGRSLEITAWISHPQTLRNPTHQLRPVYSDTADRLHQDRKT